MKKYIFVCIIIFLFTTGCDEIFSDKMYLMPSIYSIDPFFENFYEYLGGIDVLGPAISPLFTKKDRVYQYTQNALMVYDPNAPASQQYSLARIVTDEMAVNWGVNDPPENPPKSSNIPYINEHTIWEEIIPYYNRMGSNILGVPLTGVRKNSEENRYEQFLTNVGFYRSEGDPPGVIHLLPYGAWFCGEPCGQNQEGIPQRLPVNISDDQFKEADQAFMAVAERLGLEFTGYALTDTYIAEDGNYEKVSENIVLYSPKEAPGKVKLRPLSQELGITPDPPVPKSQAEGMFFHNIIGDLGYNIPTLFMDYITKHGTMEVSGYPITEVHPLSEGVSRQCFINLCLEYHADAPENIRVRPSRLGWDYQNRSSSPIEQTTPEPNKPAGAIDIQVWELFPLLPGNQNQEIGAVIFENGNPLKDVEFNLYVYPPDGRQLTYYMPPSGDDGLSIVTIDEIKGPNGTVLPYQVCLVGLVSQPVCVQESFVLWEGP